MKYLLLLLSLSLISITLSSQSVGIGTTTPDTTALLDISSNTKGLLIPRMTLSERNNITAPADGLLVYVTTDSMFYAYAGSSWLALNSRTRELMDADNDTKILIEQNSDEDIIRFRLAGTEKWVMQGGRLEPKGTGESVFIGDGAGENDNLLGGRNVGVGQRALYNNTSGSFNTATGHNALFTNTTGALNTATGYHALYYSTGNNNTAHGANALLANTTGTGNTANGSTSLKDNTTGIGNTGVGASALSSNTTGFYNTGNGYLVLHSNTSGSGNTASGDHALFKNTLGNYNTAYGYRTLYDNTTGDKNTAIGYNADVGSSNLENATAIGANTIVNQSNSLVLGSNANVGIGTSSPSSKLHVIGTVNATAFEGIGSGLTGIVALEDADNDTKILVEQNPDEDIIRFQLAGQEKWTMQGSRLESINTGNSVFIGAGAGMNDDLSDNKNVAVGDSALYNNTTGVNNTANGYFALKSNTTGFNNTAIGRSSLSSNLTGSDNTAIGRSALALNTSGNNNTAIGVDILTYNTSGEWNTAIGSEALRGNSTGNYNTANGARALSFNSIGSNNTATGYFALRINGSGHDNTGNGYNALALNQASYNTATGANALESNKFGTYNTSNGFNSLFNNDNGIRNTANGASALSQNTYGSYNTATGNFALENNTSGSHNTAIGYMADVGSGDLDNATAIGANTIVNQSNSLVLGSNANVGIGTSSPSSKLHVIGTVNATNFEGNGSALTGVVTIEDADNDTKILVEQSADEDIIRFQLGGSEKWVMEGSRLENKGTGNSVFIGEGAGTNDDLSDNNNVAVGGFALFNNTIGSSNIAIGFEALKTNTEGNFNTANGYKALYSNTTAHQNTGNGFQALYYTTTGFRNTATGYRALFNNIGGNWNTANGFEALESNTEGDLNTANGYQALLNNTTGSWNTATGRVALSNNTTGSSNTAYGYQANVGSGALENATAIGANAIVNQSNSMVLGNNANVGIGTSYPQVKLQIKGGSDAGLLGGGYFQLGSSGSHNIIFDSNEIMSRNDSVASTLYINNDGGNVIINGVGSGNMGIGTSSPTEKLHVVGNICYTGSSAACSDIRYKMGFESFSNTLDKLNKIKGQYYYWNQEAFPNKDFTNERQVGVMAQEVEAVFPEIVLTDRDGYKSVDYSRLTPILLEAIKEQQALIEKLTLANDVMSAENSSIKKDIDMIKAALKLGLNY